MRIRKYHPHKSVLFVTFSVEEGLLLLANPLCLAIVKSCLASAQSLYPVIISHFIVQATHLHLLLVVDNPNDVKDFVRHFKTESAHLLNNILGRKKRTIWCESYDSPVVLSPERALSSIVYIYTNPTKDNLEESIDAFPGLSSWKMFLKKEYIKEWKRLRRPSIRSITQHSLNAYMRESEQLLRKATTTSKFRLDPNAWLLAYGITDPIEQEKINQEMIDSVRAFERNASLERKKSRRKVIGRKRLISRTIDVYYRPERSGRRTCCLSEDRSLRGQFIDFLKGLIAEALEVTRRWRLGDFSLPFPPGLYPPSIPKLIEPLAAW